MKYLTAFLLLFGSSLGHGQSLKLGNWTGEIIYQKHKVPFQFEVSTAGGDIPDITFINGSERRAVTNATIVGDSIFIPLDPFDVSIRAKFDAMSLSGEYVKHYRNAKMPLNASFGGVRFAKKSTKRNVSVEERWKMTFSPDTPSMSDGVGLFTQMGDRVIGTVMSETSDYRYFDGIVDGDSLKLSSFDGAHAFLILGKKTGAAWSGEIVFDNSYTEPWSATADPNAELVDPFELVKVDKEIHKPYYDLLGAGSGKGSVDPSKYEGKVLLIQLFGTWCPNSHDQTRYLVDWYKENSNKNVAILASSYEANYSQEYGLKRLEEYRKTNGIKYDLVLGGRLSKTGAAMSLPFVERIKAFPTLVIVDKGGYARYVHSYFNGPATGEYYKAFDVRFNQIIDELLAE
ncbi:MAG: TlpA disulfide reductase family protein [Cyclobacteriaceae bacterium]